MTRPFSSDVPSRLNRSRSGTIVAQRSARLYQIDFGPGKEWASYNGSNTLDIGSEQIAQFDPNTHQWWIRVHDYTRGDVLDVISVSESWKADPDAGPAYWRTRVHALYGIGPQYVCWPPVELAGGSGGNIPWPSGQSIADPAISADGSYCVVQSDAHKLTLLSWTEATAGFDTPVDELTLSAGVDEIMNMSMSRGGYLAVVIKAVGAAVVPLRMWATSASGFGAEVTPAPMAAQTLVPRDVHFHPSGGAVAYTGHDVGDKLRVFRFTGEWGLAYDDPADWVGTPPRGFGVRWSPDGNYILLDAKWTSPGTGFVPGFAVWPFDLGSGFGDRLTDPYVYATDDTSTQLHQSAISSPKPQPTPPASPALPIIYRSTGTSGLNVPIRTHRYSADGIADEVDASVGEAPSLVSSSAQQVLSPSREYLFSLRGKYSNLFKVQPSGDLTPWGGRVPQAFFWPDYMRPGMREGASIPAAVTEDEDLIVGVSLYGSGGAVFGANNPGEGFGTARVRVVDDDSVYVGPVAVGATMPGDGVQAIAASADGQYVAILGATSYDPVAGLRHPQPHRAIFLYRWNNDARTWALIDTLTGFGSDFEYAGREDFLYAQISFHPTSGALTVSGTVGYWETSIAHRERGFVEMYPVSAGGFGARSAVLDTNPLPWPLPENQGLFAHQWTPDGSVIVLILTRDSVSLPGITTNQLEAFPYSGSFGSSLGNPSGPADGYCYGFSIHPSGAYVAAAFRDDAGVAYRDVPTGPGFGVWGLSSGGWGSEVSAPAFGGPSWLTDSTQPPVFGEHAIYTPAGYYDGNDGESAYGGVVWYPFAGGALSAGAQVNPAQAYSDAPAAISPSGRVLIGQYSFWLLDPETGEPSLRGPRNEYADATTHDLFAWRGLAQSHMRDANGV